MFVGGRLQLRCPRIPDVFLRMAFATFGVVAVVGVVESGSVSLSVGKGGFSL
jgi:hypothetical protein